MKHINRFEFEVWISVKVEESRIPSGIKFVLLCCSTFPELSINGV